MKSSDSRDRLCLTPQEHAQQHFQVLHSVSGRVKKRPRDSDTGNGLGSGELNAKREKAVGANVLAGELGQKGQGRKGSVLGVGRGNEDVRLGRGREREDACVDEGRRGVVVKQEPDTEEGHASSPPPSDHPSSSPASEDAAACEGADTDGEAEQCLLCSLPFCLIMYLLCTQLNCINRPCNSRSNMHSNTHTHMRASHAIVQVVPAVTVMRCH